MTVAGDCPDDHPHDGTTTCYKHHGCRCADCVDAMQSRWRDTYAAKAGPAPTLKPCGTTAAARRHYRRGEPACRACQQAVARAWADRPRHQNRMTRA